MSTIPNSDGESEQPIEQPAAFTLSVSEAALDEALHNNGVLPTQETRLTLAQALHDGAPSWVASLAAIVGDRIILSN